MRTNILEEFQPLLIGKECCRVSVGAFKSLSMGFGKRVYHHNDKLVDTYFGEWEIGTFYCSWRVIKNNKILCGASDSVDSIDDLNRSINCIQFGSIISISIFSGIDVRIEFDNGVFVDFLATISDEDEYFHIFCPDNVYIELSSEGKWLTGKSNMGTGEQFWKKLC